MIDLLLGYFFLLSYQWLAHRLFSFFSFVFIPLLDISGSLSSFFSHSCRVSPCMYTQYTSLIQILNESHLSLTLSFTGTRNNQRKKECLSTFSLVFVILAHFTLLATRNIHFWKLAYSPFGLCCRFHFSVKRTSPFGKIPWLHKFFSNTNMHQ